MVILDTDHLTLLFNNNSTLGTRIKKKIGTLPKGDIAASIVSYEEQTRGWLSFISKAKSVSELVEAYRRLQHHLGSYKEIPVVPFTESAAIEFQRFRKLGLRIGTLDLRISAIAISNDATVLTRNTRDFQQVPGLKFEDWSKP